MDIKTFMMPDWCFSGIAACYLQSMKYGMKATSRNGSSKKGRDGGKWRGMEMCEQRAVDSMRRDMQVLPLAVPLTWFPKLWDARDGQRKRWRLTGNGTGVHWDDLEEDISVTELLKG